MGKITRNELTPTLAQELTDVFNYVDGTDAQALGAHLDSRENPHGVTATQTGAPTLEMFNEHLNAINPHNLDASHVGAVDKNGDSMKGKLVLASLENSLEWDASNSIYLDEFGNIHGKPDAKSWNILDHNENKVFLASFDTGEVSIYGSLNMNSQRVLWEKGNEYVSLYGISEANYAGMSSSNGVVYHYSLDTDRFDIEKETTVNGRLYANDRVSAEGYGKRAEIGGGASDVFLHNTKSGKYLQLKDDGRLGYDNDLIYTTDNITYGTSNPRGGRNGDVYIQY